MNEQLQELARRCEAAGYEFDLQVIPDKQDSERLVFWREGATPREGVPVPAGRIAKYVLESKFDEYDTLSRLDGVWSRSLQVVECRLDHGRLFAPPRYMLESIARAFGRDISLDREKRRDPDLEIEIPTPRADLRISLTYPSDEFVILRNMLRRYGGIRPDRRPGIPVIRIEGLDFDTEQEAVEALEKWANTILFQIDLKIDLPLFPARRDRHGVRRRRQAMSETRRKFRAPEFEYDPEPMALYWYGRTAWEMPLLRFLALYQVVEYYFPVFSQESVKEEIRDLLKDPRFDVTRDSDVLRLISRVRPSRGGRGYGDEETQLQTTIQACVTTNEVREYIQSDDELKRFYGRRKKETMPVVDIRVPLLSIGADLRPQIAKRLYQIRCRIVHSKTTEGEEADMILPFSSEAASLDMDTDLMEFVARQVLIRASRPIR